MLLRAPVSTAGFDASALARHRLCRTTYGLEYQVQARDHSSHGGNSAEACACRLALARLVE